jgi:hypothetical protein
MTQMLREPYRERLAGVLSCYDRIVITGHCRAHATLAG